MHLLITCEHATNYIPQQYQALFVDATEILHTHRAIDIGALDLAKYLAHTFNAPLYPSTVSRLLIDCNRSLTNPNVFSAWSKKLSAGEKIHCVEKYYHTFRQPVLTYLRTCKKKILHLSIHSFTPRLYNKERLTEIGFLYDPKRESEKQFVLKWKKEINLYTDRYRVRMNYPYRGTSDGFTRYLRTVYVDTQYMGLEVEVNQKVMQDELRKQTLITCLTKTLSKIICV